MPTTHVRPEDGDVLKEIAQGLLKSKKVVVVTGAGISTNSGIPDFRSEHGLYSLIQAQFDAAAREAAHAGDQPDDVSEADGTSQLTDEFADSDRPTKRRKLSGLGVSRTEGDSVLSNEDSVFPDDVRASQDVDLKQQVLDDRPPSESDSSTFSAASTDESHASSSSAPSSVESSETNAAAVQASVPKHLRSFSPQSSPPSSPYLDKRRAHLRRGASRTPRRTASGMLLYSSSPLSSPPPILFDPYVRSSSPCPSHSEQASSSSTTASETDETPIFSNSFSASQTSVSSRTSLPNMKGRDLFDASIWSCPLRTSVFYTFATTLRQKAKEARPTRSHEFIRHLRDRGKLVRCYTQNIDQIEEKVGLTTSLQEGRGSRGRFSRKSTGDVKTLSDSQPTTESDISASQGDEKPSQEPVKAHRGGVECVYLHGSLESLRCFLCGRLATWEDDGREKETLSGRQPECPHCAGATAARQEKGKRALGVGKLRPDVVLYGEEHPSSHLISPIVTHDLGLNPDMLLILGTSLKVHGLKVLVREFAKAVHGKGGKVVFVNFTKPPESSWGDVIDYWIQWDCDAWVTELQETIPALWLPPGTVVPDEGKKRRDAAAEKKPKEKRQSLKIQESTSEGESKPSEEEQPRPKKPKVVKEKKPPRPPRPPAARPNALRDQKGSAAYCAMAIHANLCRLVGREPILATPPRAALPDGPKGTKTAKPRRARKSAPAVMTVATDAATMNPPSTPQALLPGSLPGQHTGVADSTLAENSILAAVKSHPRSRKRKTIDGVEVVLPVVGTHKSRQAARLSGAPPSSPTPDKPVLAPFNPVGAGGTRPPLQPLEPKASCNPYNPLTFMFGSIFPFAYSPFLLKQAYAPPLRQPERRLRGSPDDTPEEQLRREADAEAAKTLAGLSTGGYQFYI